MEKNQNQTSKKAVVPSQAQDIFEWWNSKAKIESGDSFLIKLKKVGIRILGILLMIIFSPLIAVILLFAIAVAL